MNTKKLYLRNFTIQMYIMYIRSKENKKRIIRDLLFLILRYRKAKVTIPHESERLLRYIHILNIHKLTNVRL